MADLPTYNLEDLQLAESNKLFTLNFELTSINDAEIPFVLFRNPTGSGKAVKLKRIVMANNHTSVSWIKFRAYIAPTVTTAGTAIPIACTHIGSGASSSMQAFSGSTISANGTLALRLACPAAITAPATILGTEYDYIVEPNIDVLFTVQADGNNRVAAINLIWAEI